MFMLKQGAGQAMVSKESGSLEHVCSYRLFAREQFLFLFDHFAFALAMKPAYCAIRTDDAMARYFRGERIALQGLPYGLGAMASYP